jgi:D-serine deaminase-like pyridoxal phosphate-dependent protein
MEFWYTVKNVADIPTPALLIYPDRIEENLRRMIAIAGDPEKLRPHVKTHKMAEIITLSLKAGITRFKCSTIAEAEMVAARGGKDVMLAMQPVGPQLERFFRLQREFSGTCFSALADHERVIGQLSASAVKYNMETGIWLDINNGMNRTGIIRPCGFAPLFQDLRSAHGPAQWPACMMAISMTEISATGRLPAKKIFNRLIS